MQINLKKQQSKKLETLLFLDYLYRQNTKNLDFTDLANRIYHLLKEEAIIEWNANQSIKVANKSVGRSAQI